MNSLRFTRHFLAVSAAVLIAIPASYGQNLPRMGEITDRYFYSGSGTNYAFIPGLSDGDGNAETLSLDASSDTPSLVSVTETGFDPEETFGWLRLEVSEGPGTAEITVEATDSQGTTTGTFMVEVGPYLNQGIQFEIHDIVFWQEKIPLAGSPVFDTIIATTEAPYDEINFEELDITVNAVKDDFFTGLYKGYLVPPADGDYTFSILTENDGGVWLSETTGFNDAEPVVVKSDNHGDAGTTDPDNGFMKNSDPVTLQANKVYAMYATQWIVHATYGGILWEGPGIDKDYITDDYLLAAYDTVKPDAPATPVLDRKGVYGASVSWGEGTDNDAVAGYYVYLDGMRLTDTLVAVREIEVENLEPESRHSVVVTTVDEVGNESFPSGSLNFTTYQVDTDPPQPPVSASMITSAGLAFKIGWTGAVDAETEVSSYQVYVDGERFQPDQVLYDTFLVVDGLMPGTSYEITVVSVDAAGNISSESVPFTFMTSSFDPAGENLGVKAGRFSVESDVLTYSHGIGINPSWKNGQVFNAAHEELLDVYQPGGIRWGALTANPLSFAPYTGDAKSVTIGRFMNLCNDYNAYTIFCCGVENSTDWMQDENTFLNFLEYLAGPAGTTWGDKRISEGYTESLLEGSPGLIFEFGNEVWGGESHNAQIGSNYGEYGDWCREMAALMKSSDYYDPGKIFLAYSGRYPSPASSYGVNEDVLEGDTGDVDLLGVSGYLGGNLDYDPAIPPGDSELDYYKNAVDRVAVNIEGMDYYAKKTIVWNGAVKPTYLYESNTTTPAYNGRHGQAIISIDYYLTAIEHGSIIPSVFHLTGGQWKITDPNNGYKPLPLFYMASLVNSHCKGYALSGSYITTNKVYTSDGKTVEFEPVGCHAYYDNGGKYTIVLVSRDFEADHLVQVDLPGEPGFSESATRYLVTSDGYSSRDAEVDTSSIAFQDGDFINVPAYGMVVLTFDGDPLSFEAPPIGNYDYIRQTSIEIDPSEQAITEDRGSIILNTIIEPENAFVDEVKWEVIQNDVNARFTVYGKSAELKGSGKCDGNGMVIIRASAPDDPEVFDEIGIPISGQVDNSCVSVEADLESHLRVYPNPAADQVHLSIPGVPSFRAGLYTVQGQVIRNLEGSNGQLRINLEDIQPGTYLLRIRAGDRMVVRPLMKY